MVASRAFRLALMAISSLLPPAVTAAQAAQTPVILSISVGDAGACQLITVSFSHLVVMTAQFPPERGRDVAIGLDIIEADTDTASIPAKEPGTVVPGNGAGLQSAIWDMNAQIRGLQLRFEAPVSYHVTRSGDARSLEIFTTFDGPAANCGVARDEGAHSSPLREGKSALKSGETERAIALLTKAAESGTTGDRKEAEEMLGLAYERADRLPLARATYRAYLARYPAGADAERVKQRLANVEAALEADAQADIASRKSHQLETSPGSKAALRGTIIEDRPPGGTASGTAASEDWSWDLSGTAGQFYYRDDGFGDEWSRSRIAHTVNRNEIVSSVDVRLEGRKGDLEITSRFTGYNGTALQAGESDGTAVTTAYVEMRNRLNGLSARVGRQTRYGGGVFGRFDGAQLGWQATDHVLLQVVAGSPLYYGNDAPFANDRLFAGASIDLATRDKAWALSLYAFDQETPAIVDRRAIGGELRYTRDRFSAMGAIDYDIHFGEINSASASANWDLREDVSVYASLEYWHSPFLLTSNALIGQATSDLADLIAKAGAHDVEMLAGDRSSTATSASLGIAYDVTPDWQLGLDATIADYSGTPASGGALAIPATGLEFYVDARVSGANVCQPNDYAGLSLILISAEDATSYIADTQYRFPIGDAWRLSPRLRLTWRDMAEGSQFLVMPSFNLSYQFDDHSSIEAEAAVQWQKEFGSIKSDPPTDVLLTIGYRYSF